MTGWKRIWLGVALFIGGAIGASASKDLRALADLFTIALLAGIVAVGLGIRELLRARTRGPGQPQPHPDPTPTEDNPISG